MRIIGNARDAEELATDVLMEFRDINVETTEILSLCRLSSITDNTDVYDEIVDCIQSITTEVKDHMGDLQNLLEVITDYAVLLDGGVPKSGRGKKRYDDYGVMYRQGKNLFGANSYQINGYSFVTDPQGRIVSAEGYLHLRDEERKTIGDSLIDIAKGDALLTDDRGHLIGDRFDPSSGLENLIAQNSSINRGAYNQMEKELAELVNQGKEVYYKVVPVYSEGSNRPMGLAVFYKVDGDRTGWIFPN